MPSYTQWVILIQFTNFTKNQFDFSVLKVTKFWWVKQWLKYTHYIIIHNNNKTNNNKNTKHIFNNLLKKIDIFASNFLSSDDQVWLLHLGALFFGKTGFSQKVNNVCVHTWILLVSLIFIELSHTFFFFLYFKSGCSRVWSVDGIQARNKFFAYPLNEKI